MSTETIRPPRAARGRVTQARVLHSEWIKIHTLRSTFFTLAFAVGAVLAFGPLVSFFTDGKGHGFQPAEWSLGGYIFAQLAVGVLGVLVVTGEYATGMIRPTLTAVPSRLPVLWAKAAVYAAVIWVLMTAASLTAFLLSQAILSSRGVPSTSLSAPGVTRVVFGTALYLTVLAVLSVGIGALLRNTAAGISTVLGLVLVLPILTQTLPTAVADNVFPYLPSSAGRTLAILHQESTMLAPGTGLTVFCLYAAVVLAAAAVALKRRDA
ncbi:ABC transporter permease subunit [Streptomyces xiangluensis]|uniref:ABC transporter permease n=2 Tax=Streptomyces TaxID=1883 RepID=A0A917VL31_9ACTN|nr:ABC transporter permease subunit [Streptomyces flaveus]GGK95192.1 ABC transporter permease [Streptomyces flaveus]